jgi:hypothetical protein
LMPYQLCSDSQVGAAPLSPCQWTQNSCVHCSGRRTIAACCDELAVVQADGRMHTGAQLEAGGQLLIGSNEGLAVPSAAAVMMLLAFFGPFAPGDPPSQWRLRSSMAAGAITKAEAGPSREPDVGSAADTDRSTAAVCTAQHTQPTEAVQDALTVSKADMRRCLAFVSGCCPGAQPTQGLLKQVFLHFEIASGHHRRAWLNKQPS